MARWPVFASAAAIALIALLPAARGQSACGCKPVSADWDWKANGYAVESEQAQARAAALDRAVAEGCRQAYRYLAKSELRCAAGCTAGARAQACRPSHEPGCNVGRYERDKDTWTYICRKAKGKQGLTGCDAAAAAAAPFFSMCDVPLRATASLPCACSGSG